MNLWGVSLLALVVAAGFFAIGHASKHKTIGKGAVNQWIHFVADVLGGVALAVALNPLLHWLGSFVIIAVIALFACGYIGWKGAQDIAADKKPDRWAMIAAKVVPALLLMVIWYGSTASSTIGNQVGSYTAQMTSAGK